MHSANYWLTRVHTVFITKRFLLPCPSCIYHRKIIRLWRWLLHRLANCHDSWVQTLHNFKKNMSCTGLALLPYTLHFHIWQVDSTYCSYVYVSHSYTGGNNLCDSYGRTTFNALTEISKDINTCISLKFKQRIILLQFSNKLLCSQTRQMIRSAQS